ncbi:MAG: hypothetical protein ACI85K_000424 [Hyphomicrobiaceae bacterium]|jgi:hypothetical protein
MISLRFVSWLLLAYASAVAQIPLRVSNPEIEQVSLSAVITKDAVIVDLVIGEGWHAYSRDVGGGMPLTIQLAADCDFVATGKLKLPQAHEGKVTGKARWQLPIKLRGADGDFRAVVTFQVCDELECLAPAEIELESALPMNVLLVVDAEDERSSRIRDLLNQRGIICAITTYERVTTEICDYYDVVLADSKLFREGARIRDFVLKFPQTVAPIVAVGFWGTELIEAHKVAMTSGYI